MILPLLVLSTLLLSDGCSSAPTLNSDENECTVDVGEFWLAIDTYPCDYLTNGSKDPHNLIGIYKGNVSHCQNSRIFASCCASCKLVLEVHNASTQKTIADQVVAKTTEIPVPVKEPTTQTPGKTTTPLKDNCTSLCIDVLGGLGTCDDLYNDIGGKMLCLIGGGTYRNCPATCTALLNRGQTEDKTTIKTTTTTLKATASRTSKPKATMTIVPTTNNDIDNQDGVEYSIEFLTSLFKTKTTEMFKHIFAIGKYFKTL